MGILQSLCDKKKLPTPQSSVSGKSEVHEITEQSLTKMREQSDEVKRLFGLSSELPKVTSNDIWPMKVQDESMKLLGRGSFGKVYLVKINDQLYALKQMKKKLILQKQHIENLLYERFILEKYEHPFIVKLYFAYQDNLHVNLVMEFVQGGELFYHLQKRKRFDQRTTAFFASQLVLALEFLHLTVGVVYRDLKPENVLIDKDGYIKLTDMGLAKRSENLCYSFCGTDEYLAPEMIAEKGHDFKVDIWCLGCMIYEMLFGVPPFHEENKKEMFRRIQNVDYTFPLNASSEAQELIKGLLQFNPSERLTFEQIKKHSFFKGVDWGLIIQKKVKPPFTPLLATNSDTRNFDFVFESQMKQSGNFKKEESELFKDFAYLPKLNL